MYELIDQYLPLSLWILSSAVIVILVFITFGLFVYERRKVRSVCEGAKNIADLESKRTKLQADYEALQQWLVDQKAELEDYQEKENIRSGYGRN